MLSGATHDSSTDALAPVAVNAVGASGSVYADVLIAAVGVPTPAAFTAKTRNRMGAPFVRPVTVARREPPVDANAVVHVMPPSKDWSTL